MGNAEGGQPPPPEQGKDPRRSRRGDRHNRPRAQRPKREFTDKTGRNEFAEIPPTEAGDQPERNPSPDRPNTWDILNRNDEGDNPSDDTTGDKSS